MSTDAASHPPTEEPTSELDHVTVENENAPDECAIFPQEAEMDELVDRWISAQDDSFVSLESMR